MSFSKHYACIGLDKDKIRINYLNKAIDYRECEKRHNIRQALQRSILTSSYSDLRGCNIFIVCVPTGTDIQNQPDLTPLKNVCKSLSNILKKMISSFLNRRCSLEQLKKFVFLY